jgi:DNA-3-methyladenine glycosylase
MRGSQFDPKSLAEFKVVDMKPFPQEFYLADPVEMAEKLLGSLLVHRLGPDDVRVARIVETEAYRGTDDKACHAFKGRTERTAPMFGPPGHAYVYLIYGMYDMFNIVTWPEGEAAAVLIRGVEPVSGIEGRTDGPGRLTRAMAITRDDNKRCLQGPTLFVAPGIDVPPELIGSSPRIGVGYAGEWAQKPWRFFVRDNLFVSKAPKL